MNPFRWISQLVLARKPTRDEIARARRGILSEVGSSISALHQMPSNRKNVQTIKQLEKIRQELRGDHVQVIQLKRKVANQPVLGRKDPVHEAAMRTSHQINIAQIEDRINQTAWKARQLINQKVRMHVLRTRKRGKARRGSGAA